ncbi:MAG TPA: SulP family inorganic anion transporter [Burkholderiales bacterium]|nr:SulP family inorganic anion transporter [Burkholderiales bacterium]
MALHAFHPRLMECLHGYDRRALAADVSAGVTVGVIALPLAMAFAIASGLKPEAGLFTAIIAGFLISALGGSRVQIGGPAGAFIVIVYGIVQQYGLGNLLVSTAMAGVLLFVMGLTRIGSLIRYIPVAVVIGFTNGIAMLIALSQVKEILGLKIEKMPADFFGATRAIAGAIDTVSLPTVVLGLACLALIVLWTMLGRMVPSMLPEAKVPGRRGLLTRLPSTLVVLVAATFAVAAFHLQVETIGSRFGGIPSAMPAFAWPDLSLDNARYLISPAITIALLGAVESLLCARVADSMIDERHDPNQELMAQGIANFVTPFFGGMPATGTIARTSANVRSGARSPISGIVHALTLLAIVLLAAPLASHVPLAALAAILLFVAWNMGDWGEFARLRQFSVQYRTILLATFLLTVVVDLTVAVQIGLVLAALFFIHRISSLTTIEPVGAGVELPQGAAAYRIFGSLFFGAVGKLEALLETAAGRKPPQVLILDLHMVINLDSTCLDTLEGLQRSLRKRGAFLVLCGANEHPLSLMRRSGFLEQLGTENLQPDLAAGIGRARLLLGSAGGPPTA